jgi:CheY-like chemotaxis protein
MSEQDRRRHNATPPPDDADGPESDLPTEQAVLVVEDDASAQELMRWLLPATYEVDYVDSAAAAQDALEQQSYDLILMDIDLGGRRSGVDVLNSMPEEAATAAKTLAVTAYAMPGDRERLLEAGFHGYLAKPFTRDRFLHAIADVLLGDSV